METTRNHIIYGLSRLVRFEFDTVKSINLFKMDLT